MNIFIHYNERYTHRFNFHHRRFDILLISVEDRHRICASEGQTSSGWMGEDSLILRGARNVLNINSYFYRILDGYLPWPQSQHRLPAHPTSASLNIHCLLEKLTFIRFLKNFSPIVDLFLLIPIFAIVAFLCSGIDLNRALRDLGESSCRLLNIQLKCMNTYFK